MAKYIYTINLTNGADPRRSILAMKGALAEQGYAVQDQSPEHYIGSNKTARPPPAWFVRCPTCKKMIDPTEAICPSCWTPTARGSEASGVSRDNALLCSQCQRTLGPSDIACASCGWSRPQGNRCRFCAGPLGATAGKCSNCGAPRESEG